MSSLEIQVLLKIKNNLLMNLTDIESRLNQLSSDNYIYECEETNQTFTSLEEYEKYKIKRVVVSTYQSVTGTGKKAVDQLNSERLGSTLSADDMAYKYQIDLNAIPQIDVFLENGSPKKYGREQWREQ